MKTIPLTKGRVAIVDDDMFEYLNKWKWYCSTQNRAVRTTGDGENQKMIYMHREVMKTPDGVETDHVSMNTLDNRRVNLRYSTRSENSANKKKYSTNTSGYKGVTWNKGSKKWRAQITKNYKSIIIGSYKNIEDAARAYNEYAKEVFGEYFRGNEV